MIYIALHPIYTNRSRHLPILWQLYMEHFTTVSHMKKSHHPLYSLLFFLFISLPLAAQNAPSMATKASEAAELIRARDYPAALNILNGNLAALADKAPAFTEDYLIFMKARALHLNKDHQDAEVTCDALIKQFPDSTWKHKATFLKAHTRAARGNYEAALEIYEAQSSRLFSEKRKNEVATSLMEFADLFAKIPAPEDLDAPKPDFAKAYKLYQEVLDLECSPQLKEQAHYSMIRMSGHLSSWAKVTTDSISYLQKYDPSWRGEMSSQQRLTFQKKTHKTPQPSGPRRMEVRYRMAESLHRNNQRPLAVRYLDELTTLTSKDGANPPVGLKADTAWLKLMAMRQRGGTITDVALWVKTARTYLQTYPTHLHASYTAYLIPAMLARHGKEELAITAYQEFLTSPITVAENPNTLEKETKTEFLKRQETAQRNREEASYQIGRMHLKIKQFTKARTAWNQTTKDFPNGSRWADSQKGLVNIDYQEAMQAIREIHSGKDKSTAAKRASDLLSKFLTQHPLSEKASNILFLLGRIPHQLAVNMDEIETPDKDQKEQQAKLFKEAITVWDELLSKYPDSTHAINAREHIGAIYEHRLGDMEKALATYRATNSAAAKTSVSLLTSKRLIASSPKVFRTDEAPTVSLNLRNIEKVTIRQYWLDLDSYFRKARKLSNISELDVDLVEPDKQWDVTISDFQKYLPLDRKISVPFAENRPGVCVVKVEGGGFLSTTVIVRSDIDIAVRSSKDELLAFATNWRSGGKPTAGVNVLVADGGKVVATGKTGKDGVLHLKSDKISAIKDLRVLATSSVGSATCDLDLNRLIAPPILLEQAWFNTPQQWYRPGDNVQLSGLLRVPNKGIYQVPAGDKRSWTLKCIEMTGGKLIHEAAITLNDHGSFSTEFKVPANMPKGKITATISRKENSDSIEFNTQITIKNEVRDRVLITLDFPRTWTTPGEKITGTVTANYHWGAPVSDRELEITLPNNITHKVTTDSQGSATFNYDTSMLSSGSIATFTVKMPSETSQPVRKILAIDPLGFSVEAELSHGTIASGEAFEIVAKTILPDGQPTTRGLTLEVVQQSVEKADPILGSDFTSGIPNNIQTRQQTPISEKITETIVQTHQLTTDAETGLTKQQVTLKEGGRFILRIRATDARGRLVFAESFIEVYGNDSGQKIRLLVDKNKLHEGGEAKIDAWSRLNSPTHALLSIEADSLVEYRVVNLAPGKNTISLKLSQRHAPVFRAAMMVMHQRKFYSSDEILPVERNLKVVTKITGLSEDGEIAPGGKLKVNVKLLDGNDQPQSGEISLALIDQRDDHSIISKHHFLRSHRLVGFAMGTSCGLQHHGSQSRVNLALRAEEQRSLNTPNRLARRAELEGLNAAPRLLARNTEQVRRHIYLGEGYYNLGKYDLAQAEFQKVLVADKYNKSARRWLERVAATQSDYYRSTYDQTRALLLSEVDRAWEISDEDQLSDPFGGGPGEGGGGRVSNIATAGLRSGDFATTSNSIDSLLNNPNRSSIGTVIDNRNGRGFRNNSGNTTWANYNHRQNTLESSSLFSDVASSASTLVHTHAPTLIWALSHQTLTEEGTDIELPLPEKSGSWKLLSYGSTRSGSIGQKVDEIRTVLPYDLHLQLPSSVVEGDQLAPTIILTRKNSEAAESIKLNYAAQEGENTLNSEDYTVDFAAGESSQTINTKAFLVPAARALTISVTGDKNLKTNQTLSIRPWGLPVADRSSQVLTLGKTSITLELPVNTKQKALKLRLTPNLSEALQNLALQPQASWCGYNIPFHQSHASGQLLAIASVIDHHRANGLGDGQIQHLLSRANQLSAGLAVSRNNDGSWSAVRGRSGSDISHSAMAFEALTLAKKLGITVDEPTLSVAHLWLEKQQSSLASTEVDARSLVQYALSCAGSADFSTCNRLFRERGKLSDSGKALLAAAFVNLERPDNAKTLLTAMAAPEQWQNKSTRILCTPTYIAGRALSAASAVAANGELTVNLRDMILAGSGASGFTSDLERGAALVGLTQFGKNEDATDATLTITLNGQAIGEFTTDKPERIADIDIDPKLLADGKNTLTFAMEGKGSLLAAATIHGFAPVPDKKINDEKFSISDHRYYREGLSHQGMPLKARGTSPAKTVNKGERVQVQFTLNHQRTTARESVLIERIPAGFTYETGTLRGNHSGARIEGDHLVITFDGNFKNRTFTYSMIARHPGIWRQPHTMLLPVHHPTQSTYGKTGSLTVIDSKEQNPDSYKMNYSEHNELAALHFKQGNHEQARKHIMAVRQKYPDWELSENSRMLLWIESSRETPDPKLFVESFEILNERSPDLLIPFEIITKVGKAYQTLKEYERGMDVFTATIAAGFAKDSYVGVALEDQGRYLDALDYQKDLWLHYPDEGAVSSAWFALAQQVYEVSSKAKTLKARRDQEKAPTEVELIGEAAELFATFLLVNPESPLADDAAFTQANVLFSLKKFKEVVSHANACVTRYPDSKHAGSFRYMTALGSFWLRDYDAALRAASEVAEGSSEDKNLASYITAQVYHAKGQPIKATEWYDRVKSIYPDALESIAYFEQKMVRLDEVKVMKSGEKAELTLHFRNIKEAHLQIYRVDLMKLYLREKSLSNVANVNLAGIAPKHEITIKLGAGEDFQDKEKKITLPMKADGAYLVICRGDYLYTSGLILVTPLKMEVQENLAARSLRVNISDQGTGKYLDNVHVKAIGVRDSNFKSGETDLRGVWKAENITSRPTIIARDTNGRYAFYRSKSTYSALPQSRPATPKPSQKLDFKGNLNLKQQKLNDYNKKSYNELRRSKGKGVKAKEALKK